MVLYNTPQEEIVSVAKLVKAIEQHMDVSLCLWDNSPSDKLKRYAQKIGTRYKIKVFYNRSGENMGYGSGHNKNFQLRGQSFSFFLVMNSDITSSALEVVKMIKYMGENNCVGLLTPKILYPSGKTQYSCRLLPTPSWLFLRRFFDGSCFTKKLNHIFELDFYGYEKSFSPPSVSGCFMLFRSSVYRSLGGFDERFLLYMEDIDLSRRAYSFSKSLYFPDATIVHFHKKSSYTSIRALIMHISSAIKYFNKWGWLFDEERDRINRHTILELRKAQKGCKTP